MQETLTFPTLGGSPPRRFTFPELIPSSAAEHNLNLAYGGSELSSSTSTPFVSAPSSPSLSRTPSTSKGFYFSAPTSPSWAPPITLPSPPPHHHGIPGLAAFHMPDSSCESISSWSHQAGRSRCHVIGDKISSLNTTEHQGSSHVSHKTEHLRSSNGSHYSLQADHSRGFNSAQQSLPQAAHHSSSPCSQMSLQTTHHERSSSWAPPSLQIEHHRGFPLPQKPYQTEYEKSPNRDQRPQSLLQIKNLHTTNSDSTQDFANHKALKRLEVEDIDASYSRKGFYASAVPFSWEEKPGTPKARSVTSEASYGEDDSPSNLLSGSSEFEFSARFSELEDPPMSPTPISSAFHSFKHQYAYGSPSPTHNHTETEEQVWPLRPPPRLDNPVLSMKQLIKDEGNELKRNYGSLASLSAPQSPRSPRKFDIRGAFCGISSPVDAVFDPFVAAMEKSMAKNGDDLDNEERGKSPKKNTNRYSHGHHRRSQSLSPLKVFHWDDHSAKSNSSSNGSSSMDEVKNKHPIQREINARHSAGTPKGAKRWSFKGLLHRKSVSGAESARHSNTSGSLRSSGRESCSSSGKGEVPMDTSYADNRGGNSPVNNSASILASMPSTASSILSPSSSNNSSRGKLNTHMKASKGPYALHYGTQRANTEDLRKKTFLPYSQGLLGCLGLSSKSYRALATLSKPLQPVS